MALFPKIQSPCPYKGRLSDILDGDVCRLCKREVFDLTAMSDGARVAFLENCGGEVCVTYRLSPTLAAAAFAAALIAPSVAMAGGGSAAEEVVITGGIGHRQPVTMVEPVDAPTGHDIASLPAHSDAAVAKPAAPPATPDPHTAGTRPVVP